MAREQDVSVRDAGKPVCPLKCQLRYGAAGHEVRDQVDWAGLPINLDLAFSQAQRDKVYTQHQLRKRQAQLGRWLHGGAQLCVCEIAAEEAHLDRDASQSAFAR